MTDYDADAAFKVDRIHASLLKTENAVNSHLRLIGLPLERCDECLRRIREVLKSYEHP